MNNSIRLAAAMCVLVACGDDGDATEDTDGSTGLDSTGAITTSSTGPGSTSSDGSSSADSSGTTTTEDSSSTGDSSTTGETGGVGSPFDQAVDALGGADALQDWQGLRVQAAGTRSNRFAEHEHEELAEVGTYASTYSFNLEAEQLRVDTTREPLFQALQFLPPAVYSLVIDERVGALSDPALFAPPGNLPSQSVGALLAQQRLYHPHFLLRDALADPGLVSDGGEEDVDGVTHGVVVFAGEVAEIRLFVHSRTGFITKLETLENHPLVRDVAIEVRFDGWTDRGGLVFADTVELYSGGALTHQETRMDFEVDPDFEAGTFEMPASADDPQFDAAAFEYGQQTQEVVEGFFNLISFYNETPSLDSVSMAPGVTLLASQTNSLVVEHQGGLLVVEAPWSPAHGSEMVSVLDGSFPGADITHIVQCHFHYDHAAGVRSLVAAGAALVIGEGSTEFWEAVLDAPSTIRPDELSRVDVEPPLLGVEEDSTFVLDDPNVAVTVHHASNNPHSEDFLLPVVDAGGQRFVYVSDLYNAGFGFTVVAGGPQAFFDIMRDKGIIDAGCASAVPLTIVPAHGLPQSLGDSLAELAGLGIDVGCGV